MKKKAIINSMIALFIFIAGITLTHAQTWDFTNDLEGWQKAEATNCSASWSDDGCMKITILNEQTQLFHPDFRPNYGGQGYTKYLDLTLLKDGKASPTTGKFTGKSLMGYTVF